MKCPMTFLGTRWIQFYPFPFTVLLEPDIAVTPKKVLIGIMSKDDACDKSGTCGEDHPSIPKQN